MKIFKKLHLVVLLLVFSIVLSGCTNEPDLKCEDNQEIVDEQCVDINDNAPEILGVEDLVVIVGETFVASDGVTATDVEDGSLTGSITIVGSVDTTTVGTYDLTYTVIDSGGLSTSETNTVTVELPNELPVFTGVEELVLFTGDTPNYLSGVVATDTEDGDLTASITFTDDVDVNVVGNYTVTYSVTDSDAETTTVDRNIIVMIFNEAPAIIGADTHELYVGSVFDQLSDVTAIDIEDGNITTSLVITGEVDVNTVGVYVITYTITDSDGKIATVERTVNVIAIPDMVPELFGVVDTAVYDGDSFNPLYGITATDIEDGDVTANVTSTDNVNLAVEGTYTVTVSVTDSAMNVTTETYELTVYLRESTNEEKAAQDISRISFDNGIDMPSYGSHGTMFYWATSNPRVISNRGYVVPPHVGSDPAVVTLTLRAVNGSYIETVEFYVTVEPHAEVTVTSKVSMPFEGTSEEYVVPNQSAVDIFYVDNGTVPYIDIETFVDMIDGALDSEIISFTPDGEDGLIISYEIEYEDFDGSLYTEYYTAYVDFTLNTFTVNNFDFFGSYVAPTTSDYGSGLTYVDADFFEGNEVTIPLGFYNFDLVMYEVDGVTQYLMPLHVTNLLFAGGVYYDVYYNGDKLWGIDTFGISSGSAEDLELQELVRTSSFNDATAQKDMKEASYNFMVLAFDYFYGLKEDHGVDTYYDVLYARAEGLIENSDNFLYDSIFDIAYGHDDLHTSHVFFGYFETPANMGLSLSDLGPLTIAFYEGMWAVEDLLDAKYGSAANMPDFELIDDGKTAVIHLTGFAIDTPDEFKAILDGLGPLVENVVIDLSYNTGGNLGAVLRIFGYMTEETFMYHSQNPADGSAVTYYIESEYVAYDYNWYMITSSVTFSAANLMASIAQEQGIAVLMGQDSSGGASSIGVIITPDGSVLLISTNNVLSTRVGNEVDGYDYLSIEYGVSVDYWMSNVTSDQEIIDIIAEHQSE